MAANPGLLNCFFAMAIIASYNTSSDGTFRTPFNSRNVSDAACAAALKQFGEQGVVDLTTLAGYYALLAMILNVSQKPPADGSPNPLPPLK